MMMVATSGKSMTLWTHQQVAYNGYHINQGIFYYSSSIAHEMQIVFSCNTKQLLLDMTSGVLPFDLSNPAVAPVMGTFPLHAAVIDNNGYIWATDNTIPGVRVLKLDTLLNTLTEIVKITVPGGTSDGICYDSLTNEKYVQVWGVGVVKITGPIPFFTPYPSTPASYVVSGPIFPTPWRGDHLSITADFKYMFGVAYTSNNVCRYTLPNGPFEILDNHCMFTSGPAMDGTACLVPYRYGAPSPIQPSFLKSYVLFNHNSSELFMVPTQPVSGLPISDCNEITRIWVDPTPGCTFCGEGVVAPGDWFVYAYNDTNSQIWRHKDPSPIKNDVLYMPMKPGDSVQANMLCVAYAAFKGDCIQPAGLANSLMNRVYRANDMINEGDLRGARRVLSNEVLSGLQGIARNHSVCEGTIENLKVCINTLLQQLPQ